MSDLYKKILVTGGAGFIGSNFVQYWVNKYPESQVTVLDSLTYAGNLNNLEAVKNKIHFVKQDICNKVVVEDLVSRVQAVVHFAAESHVDRSILEPDVFVKTNVLGTQTLLDAAKKYNIKRFHHVSTDEVFGQIELGSTEKWNESSPYKPRSPYSASKAASDHLVNAYFNTYGLPITITNCSNNFGPFHFPEKFIPLAITNLLEGKKIPIYKPGNQVRDWLYVTDHCSAIDLVLEKGREGETYLVGADHKEYTNLEVAKLILKIMGKSEEFLDIVGDRPGHDVKYAIDSSKIRTELGWKPEKDFENYLEYTVKWYEENQDWWKNIKNGEYQKYYQTQYGNK